MIYSHNKTNPRATNMNKPVKNGQLKKEPPKLEALIKEMKAEFGIR